MLKRTFDPSLPYRAIKYLRMSSDKQNPRSPQQQSDEIDRRIKALSHPWVFVKSYRDDALSGRYLIKRRAYQQMLQDIKSDSLGVDLIVVDMIERFGRVEDLDAIRKELRDRYGVLIVTANTNFADPTTPEGKALGFVESMRATQNTHATAHNVLRGKRDVAKLGHWPGGPAPFGYKLHTVLSTVNGRQEVDHSTLEPDPETDFIIKLLFELAERTGWGTTRLAKFLNSSPEIPDQFKPFSYSKVGYWLDSEIYVGTLVWGKHSTDIVNDTRVLVRNPEEDVVRIADFCQPLVDRERWQRVKALRDVRRQHKLAQNRKRATDNGKQIALLAPGLTLNYLLSGLLYCGSCSVRMTASSSGAYVTKSGESRRYVSYVCPGYISGGCENGTRIAEPWIRETVVGTLRDRLLPSR